MRVIAGRLRGRAINAPKGLATRPTTDRVREALFSILGNVEGDNVIDFYSGTGALGIEALSRGAAHATFVESARPALVALRGNLQRLGLEASATVVPLPVERSRATLERSAPYDLVLSDPPWPAAQPGAQAVERAVQGLLAPGARVVLGHPASLPVELPERSMLRLRERRRWGGSGLSFYEFH